MYALASHETASVTATDSEHPPCNIHIFASLVCPNPDDVKVLLFKLCSILENKTYVTAPTENICYEGIAHYKPDRNPMLLHRAQKKVECCGRLVVCRCTHVHNLRVMKVVDVKIT